MRDYDSEEDSVTDDNENTQPNEGQQEQPKRKGGRRPRKPSLTIGRMVTYVTAAETLRPAVVTRVNEDDSVDLTVFNSQGATPVSSVKQFDYDPEVAMSNTWHWPTEDN